MSSLLRAWRWLTANVIDLWKGAAVVTGVVPVLLVLSAVDQGLRRPMAWLLIAVAVVMLPLALYCYRRFAESYDGGDPSLPPLDQQPGAEPLVHVRRLE